MGGSPDAPGSATVGGGARRQTADEHEESRASAHASAAWMPPQPPTLLPSRGHVNGPGRLRVRPVPGKTATEPRSATEGGLIRFPGGPYATKSLAVCAEFRPTLSAGPVFGASG